MEYFAVIMHIRSQVEFVTPMHNFVPSFAVQTLRVAIKLPRDITANWNSSIID